MARSKTITAGMLGIMAFAAVVLVSLPNESEEFVRASAQLPCWLTGTRCDLPGPGDVAKWAKDKPDTGVPCQLGGDCDDLPHPRQVERWNHAQKSNAATSLRFAQSVAKHNGLPMPQAEPEIRDDHALVTPDDLQKKLQHHLVRKAIAKSKIIQSEATGVEAAGAGADAGADAGVPDNYDVHLGKGLLRHGPNAVKLLSNHPRSSKHISRIIAEVKRADAAQAAAKKAEMDADRLKHEAEQAQAAAIGEAKHAKDALSRAKAMETKHKNAVIDLEHTKSQLRYAQKKASEAQVKIGQRKKTAAARPRPHVQLIESAADEVDEPWESMAASPQKLRRVVAPVPPAQPQATQPEADDADDLRDEYAESRHKYELSRRQTRQVAAKLEAALSGVSGNEGGPVLDQVAEDLLKKVDLDTQETDDIDA